ncbi:hypothetical protein [Streptosporangium sp. NPDC001681]|uniref:hypothetical protein n=1 Tax=Streptosporangium sp. NPDC001681 TaxID=3154395 RepID=UPI003318DC99
MFTVGKRAGAAAALGAAVLLMTFAGAPSAHADPVPPANSLVMSDTPPEGEVVPLGASCGGITDPCGIVYNRTGATLQLSRDASSHFYCGAKGPYRDLPNGKNSNAYGSPHWPDVDCVRSRTHWIVTNGRVYPPGEWIRIWTAKWFYGA